MDNLPENPDLPLSPPTPEGAPETPPIEAAPEPVVEPTVTPAEPTAEADEANEPTGEPLERDATTSAPVTEAEEADTGESLEVVSNGEPENEATGTGKVARSKGVDPAILDTLAQLAEASKKQRLPAPEEERAAGLMKDLLISGRAGIAAALAPLVALPWAVGVNAVNAAWPTLTVPKRRDLLAGLAKDSSEPGRRLRLSLARAIFKLEPAAGLKLAAATAADLKDPETGIISSKSRQTFFNVFVGKGKPWLLPLPLADLKSVEADSLVHCAIETFPFCLPLSQLSILRWTNAAGRLKKISPADLAIAAKAVSRWNAKLQRQLKAEVQELPEEIVAVLKPDVVAGPAETRTPAEPTIAKGAVVPTHDAESAAESETGEGTAEATAPSDERTEGESSSEEAADREHAQGQEPQPARERGRRDLRSAEHRPRPL